MTVELPIDVCHVASTVVAPLEMPELPRPMFEPKMARSLSPPRSYMDYFSKIMPWSDDEESSNTPTRRKSSREFQSPSITNHRMQSMSVSPPAETGAKAPLESRQAPYTQTRARRGKPLPKIPVNSDGLGYMFGIARDVIGYAVGSLSAVAAEENEVNDRRPQGMLPGLEGNSTSDEDDFEEEIRTMTVRPGKKEFDLDQTFLVYDDEE